MKLSYFPLLVFNFLVIYYFAYGFLFPEETGFWLIHYGFPVILLEFFSVFTILSLPLLLDKREAGTGLMLVFTSFALVFVITILFNPPVFIYFVVSTGLKFIALKQGKWEAAETAKRVAITGFAIVISAVLAIGLSPIIGNAFPGQQEALRYRITEAAAQQGGAISGEIVDNPAYIAVWGILYFLIVTVLEIFPLIGFDVKVKKVET